MRFFPKLWFKSPPKVNKNFQCQWLDQTNMCFSLAELHRVLVKFALFFGAKSQFLVENIYAKMRLATLLPFSMWRHVVTSHMSTQDFSNSFDPCKTQSDHLTQSTGSTLNWSHFRCNCPKPDTVEEYNLLAMAAVGCLPGHTCYTLKSRKFPGSNWMISKHRLGKAQFHQFQPVPFRNGSFNGFLWPF